jgi:hypothetical protein
LLPKYYYFFVKLGDWQYTSTSLTHKFTGLTAATNYTLTLLTVYSWSLASDNSNAAVASVKMYTLPSAPSIVTFTASGSPSSISHSGYHDGATLTIVFDIATNQALTSTSSITMTPAVTLTSLSWTNAYTLVLTAAPNADIIPTLGITIATLSSINEDQQLRSADGRSAVSLSSSPPLGGNWGRARQYINVITSVTTLARNAHVASLPVSIIIPTGLAAAKYSFTLAVAMTSGSGYLSHTTGAISNGTSGTTSGTPYTLGQFVNNLRFTPTLGYLGYVAVAYTLTLASDPVDTGVSYYSVEIPNNAPSMGTIDTSLTVAVDEWTSVRTSSSFVLSDDDTSRVPTLPLKLTVLGSSQSRVALWSLLPSGVSVTGNDTYKLELTGTIEGLNTCLSLIKVLYTTHPIYLLSQDTLTYIFDDLGNGATRPGPTSSRIVSQSIAVILNCTSTTPAPQVLSAILNGTLNTIIVTIDLPITTRLDVSPSCLSILPDVAVGIYGSNPVCVWTSSTTLTIQLGVGATILPGASISFSANVFTRCPAMTADEVVVPLLMSSNVITPNIVIVGPQVISRNCGPLVMKSYSSNGGLASRSATWMWAINGVTVSTSSGLTGFLNVSGLTSTDQYTVTVTLITAFGTTVNATRTFEVAFIAKASLSSVGSIQRRVYWGDSFTLRGLMKSTPCYPITSDHHPSCGWNMQVISGESQDMSLVSTTQTSTSVTVDAAQLVVGNVYLFQLICAVNPDTDDTYIDYYVTVAPLRVPIATITGGEIRQVLTTSQLTLDGSSSYDPDASTKTSLSWTWSCQTITGGVCVDRIDTTLSPLSLSSDSILSIAASRLAPDHYYITLFVSTSDGRVCESSTSVLVTIVPPVSDTLTSAPLASISMRRTYGIPGSLSHGIGWPIRASVGVVLYGDQPLLEGVKSYQWWLNGDLSGDASNFNLDATSLTAGATYLVTLRVRVSASSTTSISSGGIVNDRSTSSLYSDSYASLVVTTSMLPIMGSITVSPSNQTTALSTIALTGAGFESSLPLTYQFWYMTSSSTSMTTLGMTSVDPFIDFNYLPSSVKWIGVRATDSMGDFVSTSRTITVTSSSSYSTSDSVLSLFMNGLGTVDADAEILTLIQSIASVIATLSSDGIDANDTATRLSMLTTAVSTIQGMASSSSVSTELIMDTLRTLTGTANIQLIADLTAQSSILTLLETVSSSVVGTLDSTVLSSYFANIRNVLAMILVQEGITEPITSRRRLLATPATTREAVDATLALLVTTLNEISNTQLFVDGDTSSFSQSGLVTYMERTILPPTPSIDSTITTEVDLTIPATSSSSSSWDIHGAFYTYSGMTHDHHSISLCPLLNHSFILLSIVE